MTRYTTQVTVPEQITERVTKITCDLCNKIINTEPLPYRKEEVRIEFEVADHYPEGSFGNLHFVDMCASCFSRRLVPWLESQGVTVQLLEIG